MSKTRLSAQQLGLTEGLATDQEVQDSIFGHLLQVNPHDQYLEKNKLGTPNGIPSLNNLGNLSSNGIPQHIAEFKKYANSFSLPSIGEPNVYYITLDNNQHYKWFNGNYVQVLFGWKDLISEVTPRTSGPLAPVLKSFTPNITGYVYGSGDRCECRYHIPHDYAPNTDMYVHLHWSHTGTNITGSLLVNIFATYAKGHQQASFSNEITSTILVSNLSLVNSPKYIHRVDEVLLSQKNGSGSLLNTDLIEVDGFILLTFEVDTIPSIVGSAYSNEPYIIGMDIHYQSTDITTKNKSPDFYV